MLGDDVYEQVAKYLDAPHRAGRAADAASGRGAREPRPHADPEAVSREPEPGAARPVADLARRASRAAGAASAPLAPDEWLRPTPARRWDVRDTISHLADTDEMAIDTITRRAPRAERDRGARRVG